LWSCHFSPSILSIFILCIFASSDFWCIYVYNHYMSWWLTLLSWLCVLFLLQSFSSPHVRVTTLVLFWFLFAWGIFFHSSTSNLHVYLDLKWVSYEQTTYSWILFKSILSFYAISGFNSFTLQVNTDSGQLIIAILLYSVSYLFLNLLSSNNIILCT
jgi:hypothetical protein